MKYFAWFSGDGYFGESMYGLFDEEDLPDEILIHHYENPLAQMQGITILGITKKGPDDIVVVERYKKTDPIGQNVYYEFQETVDPSIVEPVLMPDGETVLREKDARPDS